MHQKKNQPRMFKMDKYEVQIDKFSHEGRGITRINNILVFVDGAIPNDRCVIEVTKQHKKFWEARVVDVIEPSPDRKEPICEHFHVCGGCDYLHISYEQEIKWKEQMVLEILRKNAKLEITPDKVIPASDGESLCYRNKVVFHVKNQKIGFYRKQSNDIEEIHSCVLIHPDMMKIKHCLEDYDLTNVKEILLRIGTNTNEILVKVDGFIKELDTIVSKVPNIKTIVMKEKAIYGNGYIEEKIGENRYKINADCFLQVNTKQAEKLYEQVRTYLSKQKDQTILDLYCGIGSIGISVAPSVKKVIGIELNPAAIDVANVNAQINHLNNIKFIKGNVEKKLPTIKEQIDAIIVDPPRSGLTKKIIQTIKQIRPQEMVYVSCNPATLARDLSELKPMYELKNISIVDMFPRTKHVECVCLLKRQSILINKE